MTQATVWLVGAGPMARAYGDVLKAQKAKVTVIGRGAESATSFTEATGLPVVTGGLDAYCAGDGATPPSHAIIALPVPALAATIRKLVDHGVMNILVEKPAGLEPAEVSDVAAYAASKGANVYVAYNRRFFEAVRVAQEMIAEDGGVTSFRFEISEFAHVIGPSAQPDIVKANWFYANTTHVLDMAFHLGGSPQSVTAQTTGALDWHPAGSTFVGHGTAANGAPFSYHGDWGSAPRWMVEVYTKSRAFTFQPLETLRTRAITGFGETQIEIDDTLDKTYKPGVYRQTEAFLSNADESALLGLAEHARDMASIYKTILEGGTTAR